MYQKHYKQFKFFKTISHLPEQLDNEADIPAMSRTWAVGLPEVYPMKCPALRYRVPVKRLINKRVDVEILFVVDTS